MEATKILKTDSLEASKKEVQFENAYAQTTIPRTILKSEAAVQTIGSVQPLHPHRNPTSVEGTQAQNSDSPPTQNPPDSSHHQETKESTPILICRMKQECKEAFKRIFEKVQVVHGRQNDAPTPKRIRKIRNGLLMEFSGQQEAETFRECMSDDEAPIQIDCKLVKKRYPKIIIYNVPDTTENEALKDCMTKMYGGHFHIKHTFDIKRKQTTAHRVFELDGGLLAIIEAKGEVNVGLSTYRAKEYISLIRCTNCQSFSHKRKDCNSKSSHCGHCNGPHTSLKCTNDKAFCINCASKYGNSKNPQEYEHSSYSPSCPTFSEELMKYKRSISY